MRNPRVRILGILMLLGTAMLFAVLYGARAQEQPDFSQLDDSFLYPQNRTLFPRPDGGFWCAGTDGKKRSSLAYLFQEEGNWKAELLAPFSFAYTRVFRADDGFYFVIRRKGDLLIACWRDGELEQRVIQNVLWDDSRYCAVRDGGLIYLVTASPGEAITDDTPVTRYEFQSSPDILLPCDQLPQPDDSSSPDSEPDGSFPPDSEPDDSSPPDSEPDDSSSPDSEPDDSSPPDSSSLPPNPDAPEFFYFDSPLTVARLEEEYEDPQGFVRVRGTDGREKLSGRVVTGDIIEIWQLDGLDSSVTACIRGDLTGSGAPGARDVALLYDHLMEGASLEEAPARAADLDKDGVITTADLLLLKKRAASS